ncbi:hypothetical protein B7494_g5434 [Chlorociboria aeruginascens]|nr:hypothetical protein B7494_g5434 [Chlorociboria aeruginascens]
MIISGPRSQPPSGELLKNLPNTPNARSAYRKRSATSREPYERSMSCPLIGGTGGSIQSFLVPGGDSVRGVRVCRLEQGTRCFSSGRPFLPSIFGDGVKGREAEALVIGGGIMDGGSTSFQRQAKRVVRSSCSSGSVSYWSIPAAKHERGSFDRRLTSHLNQGPSKHADHYDPSRVVHAGVWRAPAEMRLGRLETRIVQKLPLGMFGGVWGGGAVLCGVCGVLCLRRLDQATLATKPPTVDPKRFSGLGRRAAQSKSKSAKSRLFFLSTSLLPLDSTPSPFHLFHDCHNSNPSTPPATCALSSLFTPVASCDDAPLPTTRQSRLPKISYARQGPLYTPEDHSARYEAPQQRYDRMPSMMMPPPTQSLSTYSYDNPTWSYAGTNGSAHTMGASRTRSTNRRAPLPDTWTDPNQPPIPMNQMSMNMHNQFNSPMRPNQSQPKEAEEDLIPTAIVIKNIPFAIKKETLIEIMTSSGCPLPYAFNYHFDGGVFRGLAFANFSTPEDTAKAILLLNNLDINGRKLRVEYKRMLPAAERDRIEREKRERRGQLQEQHQPMAPAQLHSQSSMNSINSGIQAKSPSPVSMRTMDNAGFNGLDMNDRKTLEYYTKISVFQAAEAQEALAFPSDVSPADRRIIHTLAHNMGLEHRSEGTGDMRQVQLFKKRPSNNISPPVQLFHHSDPYNESRRVLNRAATFATFDLSRPSDPTHYPALARQRSDRLDVNASPGIGSMSAAQNLRGAKSFADLRSYTPSPVPSSASFPQVLTQNAQNVARYENYTMSSANSGTPNITPTSARDMTHEEYLTDSMSALNIYNQQNQTRLPNAGAIGTPIGTQRSNGNFEENLRNGSALPERQPRGPPATDWGNGFSRPRQNGHNQRGSGGKNST